MMKTSRYFGLTLAVLLTGGYYAHADVTLPPVLSSHMVLQRETAVPLWGTATAGEKIVVQFRNQTKNTVADASGKWLIKLDSLKAGGPDTLTVAGNNKLTLEDVLVGEVWVGSGQSNMLLPVKEFTAGDPVLVQDAAAAYPKLRLMTSGSKGWVESTPENNAQFSALLFGFGMRLQKELDVPVGVMIGAVGGTPSVAWLSKPSFDENKAVQQSIADYATRYDEEYKQAAEAIEKWKQSPAAAEPNAKQPVTLRLPRYKPGESLLPIGKHYETYIRPLQPYAIRGVLWDQGENETGVGGVGQYTLMGALISGWRREWGQGDFPFLYVEKPSGWGTALDLNNPVTNKADKLVPLPNPIKHDNDLRAEFTRIKAYPNTAMVSSSDLGNGTHPTNKSGYSSRAARVAMGFVYGAKTEYYGPIYQSHQIEGNKIRVRFSHIGQGLTVPEGQKLQGFAIAGEDKQWVWADAVIDGDSVVVSSDKVEKPVAVRYAWSFRINWANLFNKDSLPTLSFRTSDW